MPDLIVPGCPRCPRWMERITDEYGHPTQFWVCHYCDTRAVEPHPGTIEIDLEPGCSAIG
jgi:hypothetical protein